MNNDEFEVLDDLSEHANLPKVLINIPNVFGKNSGKLNNNEIINKYKTFEYNNLNKKNIIKKSSATPIKNTKHINNKNKHEISLNKKHNNNLLIKNHNDYFNKQNLIKSPFKEKNINNNKKEPIKLENKLKKVIKIRNILTNDKNNNNIHNNNIIKLNLDSTRNCLQKNKFDKNKINNNKININKSIKNEKSEGKRITNNILRDKKKFLNKSTDIREKNKIKKKKILLEKDDICKMDLKRSVEINKNNFTKNKHSTLNKISLQIKETDKGKNTIKPKKDLVHERYSSDNVSQINIDSDSTNNNFTINVLNIKKNNFINKSKTNKKEKKNILLKSANFNYKKNNLGRNEIRLNEANSLRNNLSEKADIKNAKDNNKNKDNNKKKINNNNKKIQENKNKSSERTLNGKNKMNIKELSKNEKKDQKEIQNKKENEEEKKTARPCLRLTLASSKLLKNLESEKGKENGNQVIILKEDKDKENKINKIEDEAKNEELSLKNEKDINIKQESFKENDIENNKNNNEPLISKESNEIKTTKTVKIKFKTIKSNKISSYTEKDNPENKIIEALPKDLITQENIITSIRSHYGQTKAGKGELGISKINQDTFIVLTNINTVKNYNIFGVLDGHGPDGHLISQFVSKFIQLQFQTFPDIAKLKKLELIYDKLISNDYEIIKDIFINADNALRDEEMDSKYSGTTCVLVIQLGENIICANTGDSRAILVFDEKNDSNLEFAKVFPLSLDTKPENPGEKERILRMGGIVEKIKNKLGQEMGPYRVWEKNKEYPGLAMSRSIGDFYGKKIGVIPDPEIIEWKLTVHSKYIVLCSDGVWEFLNNKDVMEMGKKYYLKNNPREFCKELINTSSKCWEKEDIVIDDITVVIVFF